MKQTYIMSHDMARQRAIEAVKAAPAGYAVVVSPPTRSLDQNARLWASLGDISRQVVGALFHSTDALRNFALAVIVPAAQKIVFRSMWSRIGIEAAGFSSNASLPILTRLKVKFPSEAVHRDCWPVSQS